jgi:hypothetical protein
MSVKTLFVNVYKKYQVDFDAIFWLPFAHLPKQKSLHLLAFFIILINASSFKVFTSNT